MPLHLPSADPQPLGPGLEATDAFHRRPLFAVQPRGREPDQPPLVVRSWQEAHALHGDANHEDLNPAYVAALISSNSSASASPYNRIRRLPRSHYVLIGADGAIQTSPYDPLASGAGAMAPEALHAFIRGGLLDHLQRQLQDHSGPIGCEHSSGLDSNAVLGGLVHGLGLDPQRLHTWSLEGGGEGPVLQQFRPFYGLKSEQCHRFSAAATPTDPDPDGLLAEQLAVFGAPPQIGGNPLAVKLFQEQGCAVLFSGWGGDQALSHNAVNVPTDLVKQGRWRELHAWVGSRRASLKTAAGRALALGYRPWAEANVLRRSRDFIRSDLLERSLTKEGRRWLSPHLKEPYPWEIDQYLPMHQSIRRRVLNDSVAVRAEEESRQAQAHGMDKAFPLLDERLISTLLQQDPALFGESAGRGRLIHRRAFAPFLPPFLRDNPTKNRDLEDNGLMAGLSQQRQALECCLAASANWPPALARWWDLGAIRQEAEAIAADPDADFSDLLGIIRAFDSMDSLSGWWKALEG